MSKSRMLVVCLLLSFATQAFGQIRGAGSTVVGDQLRGAGQFLDGAGWYELNSAIGRSIDQQTRERIESSYRQQCEEQERERVALSLGKKFRSQQAYDALMKKLEVKQVRMRISPTDDEIRSGEALNLILSDLDGSTIQLSSLRAAKLELPAGMTIKRLAFKFVSRPGNRETEKLSQGVIALGRLDKSAGWSIVLRDDALAAERAGFEKAYRAACEASLQGDLQPKLAFALADSIDRLNAKAEKVVPTRDGFRTTALQQIAELKAASAMFGGQTIDFAQELLRDTQQHEAHTVGELLAFMRKYRFRFADAGKSPETFTLYGRLYDLLREQKAALGIKDPEPKAAAAAVPARSADPTGRWLHSAARLRNAEMYLKPGGAIIYEDKQTGSWSLVDRELTFRWPNAQAPNGEWVDVVRLSKDGNSYQGKNQRGIVISGFRPEEK